MRYIILIAFMLIGAYLEQFIVENRHLEEQLASSQRIINILENYHRPVEEYLFAMPIHKDDFIRYTSPFGYRELVNPYTGGTRESMHKGLDILGTYQARITAIADGIIIEHYPAPNGFFKGHELLGGMIKIDHGNGWTSVYGHMSATYKNETAFVSAGEVIGRQGNTGQSQGSHLHFELQYNNVAVNPLKYVGE